MKKPLAVALLILGMLAAVFGLSVVSILLFFELMNIGLLIAFVLIIGAAFGIYCIAKLYHRVYEMRVSLFFLCAYIPPMIGSGIFFIVVLILDKIGYFDGFLGGLGEALAALASVAVSVVLAIVGGIWLAVAHGNDKI